MSERPIIFSGPMVRAILEGRKSATRRVVKPQPEWNGARWVWPIPKRARQAGCSTTCVSASREWHEYMPPGCCPFGAPGDRLWVREAWKYRGSKTTYAAGVRVDESWVEYRDGVRRTVPGAHKGPRFDPPGEPPSDEYHEYMERWWSRWRSPIHMPRWASRLTLEVTGVRVERLGEITEEDAIAEGCLESESVDHSTDGVPLGDGFVMGPMSEWRSASGNFALGWDALNARRGFPWESDPWVWVLSFRRLP